MGTDTYTLEYFERRIVFISAGVRKIRFRMQKFAHYRGRIASDSLSLLGPYGNKWEELMETCDVFAMQYLKPLGEIEKSLEDLRRWCVAIEKSSGEEYIRMRQLVDDHFDTLTALQDHVIQELDERIDHVHESVRTLRQICEIDGGF